MVPNIPLAQTPAVHQLSQTKNEITKMLYINLHLQATNLMQVYKMHGTGGLQTQISITGNFFCSMEDKG